MGCNILVLLSYVCNCNYPPEHIIQAMLAKKAISEHAITNKGTFVSSEKSIDILPVVLENKFNAPIPEGIKALKLKEKQSEVKNMKMASHMKKVKFVNDEQRSASESIYGSLYTQLTGLAQLAEGKND